MVPRSVQADPSRAARSTTEYSERRFTVASMGGEVVRCGVSYTLDRLSRAGKSVKPKTSSSPSGSWNGDYGAVRFDGLPVSGLSQEESTTGDGGNLVGGVERDPLTNELRYGASGPPRGAKPPLEEGADPRADKLVPIGVENLKRGRDDMPGLVDHVLGLERPGTALAHGPQRVVRLGDVFRVDRVVDPDDCQPDIGERDEAEAAIEGGVVGRVRAIVVSAGASGLAAGAVNRPAESARCRAAIRAAAKPGAPAAAVYWEVSSRPVRFTLKTRSPSSPSVGPSGGPGQVVLYVPGHSGNSHRGVGRSSDAIASAFRRYSPCTSVGMPRLVGTEKPRYTGIVSIGGALSLEQRPALCAGRTSGAASRRQPPPRGCKPACFMVLTTAAGNWNSTCNAYHILRVPESCNLLQPVPSSWTRLPGSLPVDPCGRLGVSSGHGARHRGDRVVGAPRMSGGVERRPDADSAGAAASAAHRAPDGSFLNPWPDSALRGWRDVLRWMRERRTRPRAATPPRGSFPTAAPAISYPRAGDAGLAATWIGHSTVLLQIGGLNVLTDPVWSLRASPSQWVGPRRIMEAAVAIDALPPLDVVVLSHNHYDRLDRAAVRRIAKMHPRATWIAPLGVGHSLRAWGARELVEIGRA